MKRSISLQIKFEVLPHSQCQLSFTGHKPEILEFHPSLEARPLVLISQSFSLSQGSDFSQIAFPAATFLGISASKHVAWDNGSAIWADFPSV